MSRIVRGERVGGWTFTCDRRGEVLAHDSGWFWSVSEFAVGHAEAFEWAVANADAQPWATSQTTSDFRRALARVRGRAINTKPPMRREEAA